MSLIECQNCAMETDSKNKNCPVCGEKLDKPNTWVQWVAIALALIFLLTLLF